MIAPFAAAAAALASLGLWRIAQHAARTRRLVIGTLPPVLVCAVAAVAAAVALRGGSRPSIAACAAVGVAALVDARSGYVFDPLCAVFGATAFALRAFDGAIGQGIGGALAGGGTMLVLYALSAGRGLGLGDVKLAAAIGTALGAPGAAQALAVAFVSGAGYGVWLLATRRARRGSALPFAPFLAAGTWAASLHVPGIWG